MEVLGVQYRGGNKEREKHRCFGIRARRRARKKKKQMKRRIAILFILSNAKLTIAHEGASPKPDMQMRMNAPTKHRGISIL